MSSANLAGYDPIQTSIRQIIGFNKGTGKSVSDLKY